MFSYKVNDDIELRLLDDHHAKELFALVDANRNYLREWLPWVDAADSVDNSLNNIRQAKEKFAKDGTFDGAVFYQGQLMGKAGIHDISAANKRSSIGYWLDQGMNGKGIMTACVSGLLDYSFDDLDLNYMALRSASANYKSQAVAKRLGFKHEGTLRDYEWLYDHFVDMEHYGIRACEWKDQKQKMKKTA